MIPATPKPSGDDWKRAARRLEIFMDLLLAQSAMLTNHILDDRFIDVRQRLCCTIASKFQSMRSFVRLAKFGI